MEKAVIVNVPENTENDFVLVYRATTKKFEAVSIPSFLNIINTKIKDLEDEAFKLKKRMDTVVEGVDTRLKKVNEIIKTEINIREGDNN